MQCRRCLPRPNMNLTLRRLRGGVKIRKANFWGVAKSQTSSETLHPPRPLSRSHPPPQAAGGKKILPFPHLSIPSPYSIPAKAGISSRASGKFREAEAPTSPIGECGYRRRDSRFRPPPFPFPPHLSIPAKAGNSAKRKCNVACGDAWRTMPPREIPAFAGMEGGAEMKDGDGNERRRACEISSFCEKPPFPPQKIFFKKVKKFSIFCAKPLFPMYNTADVL